MKMKLTVFHEHRVTDVEEFVAAGREDEIHRPGGTGSLV